MSFIDHFQRFGLAVTWGTLLVGLEGPGKLAPQVTADEVRSFASDLLAAAPDDGDAVRVVIAEDDEIAAVLRELAGADVVEQERDLGKWRLVLLERTLETLPHDPLYALLELTAFWERFDFPADSPHVVQGRGNDLSPPEYFTEANLRQLLAAHHRWIELEKSRLSGGLR